MEIKSELWRKKVEKLDDLATSCKRKKLKSGNYDSLAEFLAKEIVGMNDNIKMAALRAAIAVISALRKKGK